MVLMISALLLGAVLPLVPAWMNAKKRGVTRKHIQEIREGLARYNARTGTYPCPTSRLRIDNDYPFAQDCLFNGFSDQAQLARQWGVFLAKNGSVIEGGVPFRLINIPKEAIFDGWDNMITYAVTAGMTVATSSDAEGRIAIVDRRDRSVIDPPSSALWALVSHGPDGAGAYNGTTAAKCLSNHLDGKNCDRDGIFIADEQARAENAAYYDDIISYAASVDPPPDKYPAFCLTVDMPGHGALPVKIMVVDYQHIHDDWITCHEGALLRASDQPVQHDNSPSD